MRNTDRSNRNALAVFAVAGLWLVTAAASHFASTGTTISVSPSPAKTGQTVTVTLSGAECSAGVVSFGDGVYPLATFTLNGSNATVQHVYASAGTYTIRAAWDTSGEGANKAEIKGYRSTPDRGCIGGPVTITVLAGAPTVVHAPAIVSAGAAARPQCPACMTLVGDGRAVPFRCQMTKPACPAGMTWFEQGSAVGCRAPDPGM